MGLQASGENVRPLNILSDLHEHVSSLKERGSSNTKEEVVQSHIAKLFFN
ncbi:MAG: hypothetical protein BAJALOKI1v1_850006 [Promethearchaeota archaeon]|nr:MAG: hypothetical protein BAJALOKI1v1_850006 [Candidatus Lokiarchaeota archaeon]